jgi:hypothetical protein
MGAIVWLISEDAGGRTVAQILSNQHGAFLSDHLKPGNYAVRVSLAGFLPAMETHIAVMSNLTTLLRVQVETVFSSLDTLRRKSDIPAEPDDWKWVLRQPPAPSCSGMIPVTRSLPTRWGRSSRMHSALAACSK